MSTASLTDLLTAAKNIAVGINALSQAYLNINGVRTVLGITAPTVAATAAGRACRVSVLVAGSAPGALYDTTLTTTTAVANELWVIPNTVGEYEVNLPTFNGLVVTPGTGQTVTVSYS